MSYMSRTAPPVAVAPPVALLAGAVTLDPTKVLSPLTLAGGQLGGLAYPWDFLASKVLSADAATFNLTFAARDMLRIFFLLQGSFTVGTAPFPLLRFDGDAGANYNWIGYRMAYSGVLGGAPSFANWAAAATTSFDLSLGGNYADDFNLGYLQVINRPSGFAAKQVFAAYSLGPGGGGTDSMLQLEGSWKPAVAADITEIDFASIVNNYGAGTKVVVLGRNF